MELMANAKREVSWRFVNNSPLILRTCGSHGLWRRSERRLLSPRIDRRSFATLDLGKPFFHPGQAIKDHIQLLVQRGASLGSVGCIIVLSSSQNISLEPFCDGIRSLLQLDLSVADELF